ncbi:tRNA guanosine(34) transglycosylase Tgt [Anaplasma bovis]|uniref:tRNA guanosine(34) transglycosylase Tgt n=1 Tax=Anaplasma bovis TaxID=186733 RepID=UPI002FEF6A19
MYKNFSFKVLSEYNKARIGILHTPHGIVHTPAFIFCATKASIKSLPMGAVRECGTQIILSNTYHLALQPGEDVIQSLGGLHKMMGWNGPMLTDSGGYQIFSLGYGSVSEELKNKRKTNRASLLKIDEDGARFRSHINGKTYYLTPEVSMDIQRKLGADLVVVLDECTPFHTSYEYTKQSMRLSTRWARRSLTAFENFNDYTQALYCVVQGGVYSDLRRESCEFANNSNFFGNAIGGSLGACKSEMYDTVSMTNELLDKKRPVHLLGIGNIVDVFQGALYGIDTFDCVYPTRIARHGSALVKPQNRNVSSKEYINLNNAEFRNSTNPIEECCTCYTCKTHSTGYLHHLLKARELLAYTLLTIHNIHFMNNVMQLIRRAIASKTLEKELALWCEGIRMG